MAVFARPLLPDALEVLDQAGAKVVAFDLLFTEPDEPVPADLREAVRAAAEALTGERSDRLRAALQRLDDSDRDSRFAAAIRASGNVLLPIGLSFVDTPGEEPAWLSDRPMRGSTGARCRRFSRGVPNRRFCRSRSSAPLPPGSASTIALDRDGAPRYDYIALPFEADFLPSLPIRAAAAYLGVAWPEVALALGAGVRIGELTVPTDRAMRLLINYRGPRGTFPSFSFADLLAGRVAADQLSGRIVLIGASFIGSRDSYASALRQYADARGRAHGQHHRHDRQSRFHWRTFGRLENRRSGGGPAGGSAGRGHDRISADALGGARRGGADRGLGRRRAAGLCAGMCGCRSSNRWPRWRPPPRRCCCSAIGSSIATAAASARPSAIISRPSWSPQLAADPERLQLGGETRPITIMFADIRGFTAISEGFNGTRQALSRLINPAFSRR